MKRLKVFISVILLLIICLPELSAARISGKKIGPNTLRKKIGDSSGGGFTYKDTVYKHLQKEVDYLWRALSAFTEEEFNRLVAKYTTKKIDLLRFREIIQDIELSPMQEKPLRKRFNKDGNEESISLDYNIETKRIVALKKFFDTYHKDDLSEKEQERMRKELMHEATHLFDIGIEKDKISEDITRSIMYGLGGTTITNYVCGKNGTIDRRVEACNQLFSRAAIDVVSVDFIIHKLGFPIAPSYEIEEIGYRVLDTKDQMGVYVAYPYWYSRIKITDTRGVDVSVNFGLRLEANRSERYCNSIGENWTLPSVENVKDMINILKNGLSLMETNLAPAVIEMFSKDIKVPMIATNEDGKIFSVNEDLEVEELSIDSLWSSLWGPDFYNVICVSTEIID